MPPFDVKKAGLTTLELCEKSYFLCTLYSALQTSKCSIYQHVNGNGLRLAVGIETLEELGFTLSFLNLHEMRTLNLSIYKTGRKPV